MLPTTAQNLAAEPWLVPSRKQSVATILNIDTVERGDSLVLMVEGELDISNTHLLDEALVRAQETDAVKIVVDLQAVSFIDSTGLHVLIKHACGEESRGRIRLTTGSRQVQRLFELTGARDYLPFV
jgi:anti-sigma B factor antagonist